MVKQSVLGSPFTAFDRDLVCQWSGARRHGNALEDAMHPGVGMVSAARTQHHTSKRQQQVAACGLFPRASLSPDVMFVLLAQVDCNKTNGGRNIITKAGLVFIIEYQYCYELV